MSASRDWAVVTGASSGIGREFAKLFAQDGINLVLTARRGQALASLAAELEHAHDIKTLVYAGDLSDLDSVETLLGVVEEANIRVKYLINNAGFGNYAPFTLSKWEVERGMIGVNIMALTYLSKEFARRMRKQKFGHIVNLGSLASFIPGPNMAVYYATKAYVLSLSEALHEELRGTGVTVTALCPGPTSTSFAENAQAAGTRVFRGNVSTAEQVAKFGYKAMNAGRPVAIPSVAARFGIWFSRLLPRSVVPKIVNKIQG